MSTNVLVIDNFSRLHGLPADTSWLRVSYLFFNEFTDQSYAQTSNIPSMDNHPSLYLSGRSENLANWYIGTSLPEQNGTYTVGVRIVGVPATSRVSASLGIIANPTESSYDTVLAIELTPNGAILHYKDSIGPKTQIVEFAYEDGSVYLDFTFNKESDVPNAMTRLTMMANNMPVFDGDVFNNVGQNLAIAYAGVLPTEPDDSIGYLRHTTVDDAAPTNLEYSITDMYVSKGGQRFGLPTVVSEDLDTATGTGIHSADPDLTLDEVLREGPKPWTFGQGYGTVEATFKDVVGEASQFRVIAQSQDSPITARLIAGIDTSEVTVQTVPTVLSVVAEGSPDMAMLEIDSNE